MHDGKKWRRVQSLVQEYLTCPARLTPQVRVIEEINRVQEGIHRSQIRRLVLKFLSENGYTIEHRPLYEQAKALDCTQPMQIQEGIQHRSHAV